MTPIKLARRLAVATAAVTLFGSAAFAGDNQNMTVQAKVIGTCKFVTVPLLDFGTLNQVTAPAVNPPAVDVTYRCTKNTAPSGFTVGGSNTGSFTGSLSNGIDPIAYSITWTAPVTAGLGLGTGVTPVNVALTGSIAATIYQNVSAGTYTQLVAIVIAP